MAKRGPTGLCQPLQIQEAPWDKRDSPGLGPAVLHSWKAVSTGASWSGRGFRWEFSTAVRQYQYKQSHFQRDSAGSCLRVVLPGSLAGSGVEGARSTMCPGVSVYPRENKGSVIKSLE